MGLAELGAASLVAPKLIFEIDFKEASQFVLIKKIFVCSLMDFLRDRETDMIPQRPRELGGQ